LSAAAGIPKFISAISAINDFKLDEYYFQGFNKCVAFLLVPCGTKLLENWKPPVMPIDNPIFRRPPKFIKLGCSLLSLIPDGLFKARYHRGNKFFFEWFFPSTFQ